MNILKTIAFIFCICAGVSVWGQSGINYQAIARNANGVELKNTAVSVDFIIHDGSAVGPSVFNENHATNTNAFGLVTLVIGSNNVAAFAGIDWSSASKWLEVRIDGTPIGTEELQYVPFALSSNIAGASVSGSFPNGSAMIFDGTNWVTADTSNWSNSGLWRKVGGDVVYDLGNVGIGTAVPDALLDIDVDNFMTPKGDVSILLGEDGGDAYLETRSGDMSEGILMHGNGTDDAGLIYNIASNGYMTGLPSGLHAFTRGSDPIIFTTNSAPAMRVTGAGNLAIGATGNSAYRTWIQTSAGDATSNGLRIDHDYDGASTRYGVFADVGSAGTGQAIGVRASVSQASGEASQGYGLYSYVDHDGIGNSYALYCNSVGSTTGSEFGVYVIGEDYNYMQGSLGVGISQPTVKMQVDGGGDASLAGGGYFLINAENTTNIVMDNNEIMARNNGAESPLYMQNDGGDFWVHNGQAGETQFVVQDDGDVGVGTSTPATQFEVWSASNNTLRISGTGTAFASGALELNGTGNTGDFRIKPTFGILQFMIGDVETGSVTSEFLMDGLVNHAFSPGTDGLQTLGTTASYWANVYSNQVYVKQTGNGQASANGVSVVSSAGSDTWKMYHSGSFCSFALNNVRQAYIATNGTWTVTSDRRFKNSIAPIESVLPDIMALEPVSYEYNSSPGQNQIGLIAQDVEAYFPEVVSTDEEGMKGIGYSTLSVVAIKGIQEQQEMIKTLLDKVESLEVEIQKLKNQ